MGTTLGKLERVKLRDAWSNEATDFTPWLSRPENLKLLAEVIGLDLEPKAQEVGVGPFRADILCKDTATGHYVLVENQLERTNHTHLGQLLTYAAGLDAVSIVWVAERFTEEHRAALDWLNSITEDDVNFFGLEIELWKIGASDPAPKLNLVSKPNEWTRQVTTAAKRQELTENQRLQVDYWNALNQHIEEHALSLPIRSALPDSWKSFPIGRSGFHLSAACNSLDRSIKVELVMDDRNAKAYFALLEPDKKAIEREIGHRLEWLLRPEAKLSYVRLTKRDEDYRDRSRWPKQHAWLAEQLTHFDKVFRDRIKNLEASDAEQVADYEDEG